MFQSVEWVRDNIAAFGGDPARITLWGKPGFGDNLGYLLSSGAQVSLPAP